MFKVLIVDDEVWIRRGITSLLDWEAIGLEIIGECENGKEAFQFVKKNKPDLILMDMRMPGWNGKDLIRKLYKYYPNLIVIVISGYSDFEYTREALKYGAFDYLLKPVKKEELIEVISKVKKSLNRINTKDELSKYDLQSIIKQLIFRKNNVERQTLLAKYKSDTNVLSENFQKVICVGELDNHNKIVIAKENERESISDV